MKIICVGRNYVEHIEELKNEKPKEPVIFLKPKSAILPDGGTFSLPHFSQNIHYEVEILLKIVRKGKNIPKEKAPDYYEEIGLGIDFTARDVQDKLKAKRLPWDLAKGFDQSAVISKLVPKKAFQDLDTINFSLLINDNLRQKGNTSLMIFNFNTILSFISQYMTLEVGDIIFTGTPAGVGKVVKGDILTGYIENTIFFRIKIDL